MTVYLVGAGPGDPDLLTVRGARLVAAADIIVHDRLVSDAVLALARPDAEIIDVGKRPGCSNVQDVLNELLVTLGRSGRTVVRLKGGDPFVFGRGGEEVEVLRAAGIACEVVPGITSAFAAPLTAGIPVTHRDLARAVTVVTGHEALSSPPVAWEHLAALGGTLVVLMGTERRGDLARRLIDAGMAPETPVAAVHKATWSDQEVVSGRLDQLGALAVRAPAVLVIGAVAALADHQLVATVAEVLPPGA